MQKKPSSCRVCAHRHFQHLYTEGIFSVWRCTSCGFGTLHPLPSQNELLQLYQEDYHQYIHDDDYMQDAYKKFTHVEDFLNSGNHILDVGCGLGHFLALAQENGLTVQGYDVSQDAAKSAKQRFNVPVATKTFNQKVFQPNTFQAITLFDVIEHIVAFQDALQIYHHWLAADGLLIMTTPDFDSWDARLLGKKWYGFTRIPQHVNYFDRSSLRNVLEEQGFQVVDCRLWGFVRSLGYLADAVEPGGKLRAIVKALRLEEQQIYLPMTDMMVVARKMG